ncbi:MAG: flagellar export protein FliJ [Desulfobacterales bacterium]|nr:flagellar export protein FliJ [Desulfobacterales bacterium]
MKRFQFKIEPVLRLRTFFEKKAKLEVAKVRVEILESESRINAHERELEKKAHALVDEMDEGVSATRLKAYSDYLKGVTSSLASEKENRERLEHKLIKKQKDLVKRSIDRKVLDKLKERKKEEYYDEMLKFLQKESDDTIILREARKLIS